MKILIETDEVTLSLSTKEELCGQVLRRIKDMLIGVGFQPEAINDSFCEIAQEVRKDVR